MTVDVAIRGQSPAALAAAWELSRRGVRVALGGSPPPPGLLGLALPATPEHFWVMAEGVGREQAALWWGLAVEGARVAREALAEAGCPLRAGALLQLAATGVEADEMARGLAWLAEAGFAARQMSAGAASNYVCVDQCEGALYLPGAALFDPAAAHAALLTHLQAAGVALGEGQIRAEIEIVVSGLSPLVALSGRSVRYEPVVDAPRSGVVALTANRCHELYDSDGTGLTAAALDPGGASVVNEIVFEERLRQVALSRFPEVDQGRAVRSAGCLAELTPDGIPLVGAAPGQPSRFLLGGFGVGEWGWGFGAGLLAARTILGESTDLPRLSSGSPKRFQRG